VKGRKNKEVVTKEALTRKKNWRKYKKQKKQSMPNTKQSEKVTEEELAAEKEHSEIRI
jgi:hypothetical protein